MTRVKTWEVSDEFWALVEPHVPQRQRDPDKIYKRKSGGGRKPAPARNIFAAIVYVLRNGMIWNALPKEKFGVCSSTVHRVFLEWCAAGFFVRIWQAGLAEYDDLEGIAWEWQAADGCLFKAPLATEAVGPNPTDRGKKGSKRHLLVDEHGVPLSIIVTAANVNDGPMLAELLEASVVEAPPDQVENLCLDAGYAGKEAEAEQAGYVPHIRPRNKERDLKAKDPSFKPRRWVVELSHSWFHRFRKLSPRYEKTTRSYLGLVMLAATMITLNKVMVIYG